MRARLIGVTLAASLGLTGLLVLAVTMAQGRQGLGAADQAQVRSFIRQELRSTEGQRLMRQAAEDVALSSAVRAQVESPRTQQKLYTFVRQALATPETEKAMEQSLKRIMASPDVKRTIDEAVKRQVTSIVQKGTGGAGGGAAGGGAGGGGAAGGGAGGGAGGAGT